VRLGVLLAGAAGGIFGVGVWLAVASLRGVNLLPQPRRLALEVIGGERATVWLATAVGSALVVGFVTGWPVAGAATFVGFLFGPVVLGGTAQRRHEAEVAEAVATWTDMIRDTMAGASGLEEALIQTAAVAPAQIRPSLTRFSQRLRHHTLDDALTGLAADLDHPSADLVVAALAAAGRLQARDLGALLARLAETIRGDVRMRVRVEVGRARIRTSARIAVVTTLVTVTFLYVFARHLLEPYDSLAGQLWLLVVSAVFFAAGWLLHRYSRLEVPERFTLRPMPESEGTTR
jgi:tight adherence protein B